LIATKNGCRTDRARAATQSVAIHLHALSLAALDVREHGGSTWLIQAGTITSFSWIDEDPFDGNHPLWSHLKVVRANNDPKQTWIGEPDAAASAGVD
jgi:hypothetical protein